LDIISFILSTEWEDYDCYNTKIMAARYEHEQARHADHLEMPARNVRSQLRIFWFAGSTILIFFAMANNHLKHHSEHAHAPLQARKKSTDAPKLQASGSNAGRSQLGVDFKPSCYSVICGRGKGSYNHAGNHHFRELAKKYLKRYTRARTTAERVAVFADLVDMIHQTGGIFCMCENAAWFEVGDHSAREKASALLRDMRFKHRLSKTKAKPVCRRTQKQENAQAQHQVHQYSLLAPPQNQQYISQLAPQNQQYISQLAPLPYSQLTLPQNQQYVPDVVGSNGYSNDTTYTRQTQRYVPDVVSSNGHLDDTTYTSNYVQQLIDGTSGHWNDSLGWGSNNKDLIEFENSLEYEDDLFDVFRIDSFHATRFTPSTPSAHMTYQN
jgi:hypothetical protein